MSLQPDTRATAKAISEIADLIPHYTDLYRDQAAITAIAAQWYTLGFRADSDLPHWLGEGWLNPDLASAAAAGLTPDQAVTAAEHALAADYLDWWERDDNPYAACIAGETGEAWDLYIDDTYPSLTDHTRYSFCDRTAFAVKAACSGLLIVNFAVYASRRRYTLVT
ncbi:MAG: hypothetical protein F9K13_11900 [Candidatus Methylomirabilis oxygeniifera]|uniref:Uncharacterized protein n=1 Tax=Methylomirabilis oxygeniifera TaxID=671143 RepID=D5MG35_METO1|nr:MAG: hypothetical protein F9K13_11900 [Candidatus Methylomirabilis oxyfera]CBE68716.1 protein of unknown function [Candidatus Methylomirabilis oxyfera]